MRQRSRRIVAAGVTVAGFACLLGAVFMDVVHERHLSALVVGGAGVAIMVVGGFGGMAASRRNAVLESDDSERRYADVSRTVGPGRSVEWRSAASEAGAAGERVYSGGRHERDEHAD
jgi:hypothetical protein